MEQAINYTELDEAAERGAEYLDRIRPRWYNQISVDELIMRNGDGCILGQLYGDYSVGLKYLNDNYPEDVEVNRALVGHYFEVDHGFYISSASDNIHESYSYLEKAWTIQIQDRKIREAEGMMF
jgi:hypothetical protein